MTFPMAVPTFLQRVRPCLAICFVCGVCVPLAAQNSQQDKGKLAYNHLSDVDADFPFMGEYQGNGCDAVGVQVVALGDGTFGGMLYAGGLPGTGWNRSDRTALEGRRVADHVELSGEAYQVRVAGGTAHVSVDGRWVAQLGKVHRRSATLGMPAPPNAIVLFNGSGTDQFQNGRMTDGGLLMEGTQLVNTYRDYTLHVEFQLPYMPYARGQGRSNSGVYLQSSYEVQILDSFGLEGVFNECAALYRYRKPDLNMCLPPLSWQTYDLTFRSPRFDAEGKKIQNASITVLHNGVAVHDHFEVERKTGAGKQESPKLWPTKFQDHSNPVRFRNMWLIDLGGAPSLAKRLPRSSHEIARGTTNQSQESSGMDAFVPPPPTEEEWEAAPPARIPLPSPSLTWAR